MADPHLRVRSVTLDGPLPIALEDIASLIREVLLEDILEDRIPMLIVLTFADGAGKLWEMHDGPNPADDLVRAIAQQEGAEVLAVVHRMPVPEEVSADRAVNIAIEAPAGIYHQLVALQGPVPKIYGRHVPDAPPLWLGVPATHGIHLRIESAQTSWGTVGEA